MLATVAGREARRPRLPAIRWPHVDAGYDRLTPGLPGRLRDRRRRHRHRPLVAGLRRRRLQLLPRARPGGRRHPQPGAGQRRLRRRPAAVRRPEHLEGEAAHHRGAARRRPPARHARRCSHSYPHCWRHKTPVIYRAAAQWFVRMDEGDGVFTVDKAPQDPAPDGARGDRRDRASIPRTAAPACAT